MYFSHGANCTVSWFAHLIYDTGIPHRHLLCIFTYPTLSIGRMLPQFFFFLSERMNAWVSRVDFSNEEYFSCHILRLWVHAKLFQSCPTLCDPMDCTPPGSSVHGMLQVRILEWVAMPSSRGSSGPRDRTCISFNSCIAGRFFSTEPLSPEPMHEPMYPYRCPR